MARKIAIGLLLALAACDAAPPQSPPSAQASNIVCVHERVTVRLDSKQIFWNGEAIDEAELARRSAAHWCGDRPYVIIVDQALPDPGDQAGHAFSLRVGRLIGTKQATLADTLRQLADGTY